MTDQKPPSNEAMGKVIAKMKGWKTCLTCTIPDDCGFYDFPGFIEESDDGSCNPIRDPRCNTDAALELLHWVTWKSEDALIVFPSRTGWQIVDADTENIWRAIPAAGEPFRTAVCNLAAMVLGVE